MHQSIPPQPAIRRRARMIGFDYSRSGAYFVTLCTESRVCLLGDIVGGRPQLNSAGEMVAHAWKQMPAYYPGVTVDASIVMPNHLHGVVVLNEAIESTSGLSLIAVVQRFKSLTTRRYMAGVTQSGWPPFNGRLWQRSFYDHVIRNDEDLNRVRQYIQDNPAAWTVEDEHPCTAGGHGWIRGVGSAVGTGTN